MARIRTLKPTIWESEQFSEVSIEARLTFIGLITQADDEGRLKGSPRRVKGKLWMYDETTADQVHGWLTELADNDLIVRYESGGERYIALPTWHEHQKINRPNDSALPSPSEADSRSDHGAITEQYPPEGKGRDRKGVKEGKGRESEVVPTSDAPLSHLLASLIEANGAKKPKVSKAWVDAEDRMIRLDERDPDQAERLLRWAQRDEFWQATVLSMPKFRNQYDQLLLQAKRKRKSTASPGMAQAEQRAAAINRKREARAAA